MRKFTFIGAGSLEFTNELVRDLMTFPAFDDCELMLMDIDFRPKRIHLFDSETEESLLIYGKQRATRSGLPFFIVREVLLLHKKGATVMAVAPFCSAILYYC